MKFENYFLKPEKTLNLVVVALHKTKPSVFQKIHFDYLENFKISNNLANAII
jgi:hypothetical protein